MELIKQIITANTETHKHFDYYLTIIEVIEDNIDIRPDVSIESCKSLVEGISKAVLKNIDATYNDKEVDSLDFYPLFKRSINKIAEYNNGIEGDFIIRACSLIQVLGEIRNKRGDISHGKLSPKSLYSSSVFAKLVVQLTEGMLAFILDHFFTIDFQSAIDYQNYKDFNKELDEQNPLIGNLSYSKALFDQDIDAYIQELNIFLEKREQQTTE